MGMQNFSLHCKTTAELNSSAAESNARSVVLNRKTAASHQTNKVLKMSYPFIEGVPLQVGGFQVMLQGLCVCVFSCTLD